MPRSSSASSRSLAVLLSLALAVSPAFGQADRERQQMMQLQQQLQKLRQENSQLQKGQAQEVEKAHGEAEKIKHEAAQLRASSSGSQREAKRLTEELSAVKATLAQSQVEADKLRADLAQRDAALQVATQQMAREQREAESAASVLGARLKSSTARAELCEAKHESAMDLGKELIDRYESRQLRACEPFSGLWRVREEQQIQALRDRLFEARLDVPVVDTSTRAAGAK